MIEVQLRPGVPGCVTMPLGCLSLGLIPLLMRWGERHFARRMDQVGVETRSGKKIAWSEFTSIKRAQGIVGPGRRVLRVNVSDDLYSPTTHAMSDEYWLESPQGRVSVPFWRTVNGDDVRAFTLAHMPPHLLPPNK
jgi:hypothetical protein